LANPDKNLLKFIRESIVTKSSVKILFSALIIAAIGLLIALLSSYRYQQTQLENSIQQLATTVESSANIAAFTNDDQLAREVIRGLLTNHIVKHVVLTSSSKSGEVTLAYLPNTSTIEHQKPHTKSLHSPFNAKEKVGEIKIWLNEDFVQKQTNTYVKLISFILLALTLSITALLSWIIYQSITKPIKSISDEIHQFKLDSQHLIQTPEHHQDDEIGRLVSDTNLLITRLQKSIENEHLLTLKHWAAEQRLRMIFENSQTGMFVIDNNFIITSWNPALLSMLNLEEQQINNSKDNVTLESLLPEHYKNIKSKVEIAVTNEVPVNFTLILDQENGKHKWLAASILDIGDDQIQGILNDVTSHKVAELRAIKIAERDPLTQLLNRRGFEPKLDSLMQYSTQVPSLALLVIDLDGFKQINDNFGHDAGDYVLKLISSQLIDSVRKDDLVARLGGDEFAIILDSIDLPKLAYRVAKIIVKKAANPIEYDGKLLQVGVSIGIALADEHSSTSQLLIKHADEAMYIAKQAGKSCYHLYNS